MNMTVEVANQNEKAPRVVIDLSASGDACAFENTHEIIQQEAMHDFFKHVAESQAKANEYRRFLERGKLDPRMRYHDTIVVSGSRGSGKSTFMLSMFEMLKDQDKRTGISEAKEINDGDIYVLGILDPTLIEEKDHVFVHILSLIKEHVDRRYESGMNLNELHHYRKSPCRYEQGSCNQGSISEECYRDWQNLLYQLAAGLPTIAGMGNDDFLKSEKWHDPVYVLETGLRNTHASYNLELNFHQFIDKSLRLLDKKSFIIGFDDIDTRFQRGWPLLEIIRKYLTTPQLITVISGDMELYSILVRSRQWKNFGATILKQEKDRKQDIFQPMVNKLEEQYMLKLLKPMRRMELRTLHHLYERAALNKEQEGRPYSITVKQTGSGAPTDIRTIIEKIVNLVFRVKGSEKELYIRHIMHEPLRTILRLLRSYVAFEAKQSSEARLVEKLLDAFIDIYHVQLMQFDFDMQALRAPDPRITFNQLMYDMMYRDFYKRGYRLKADFQIQDHNRLMMVLAAVYNAQLLQHPMLFFDYFIKVGLSHEVVLADSTEGAYEKYMNWVGLWDGETSITAARLFIGYLRGITNQMRKSTVLGTVALTRPEQKKSNSVFKGTARTIVQKLYGYVPDNSSSTTTDPRKALLERIGTKHPLWNFLKETSFVVLRRIDPKTSMLTDLPFDAKQYYYNTLEELEGRISSWHRLLINLPANRVINNRNEASVFWSIHGLLALFSEILACNNKEEIRGLLVRLSQLRDYPQPSEFDYSNVALTENAETDQVDDEESAPLPDELIENVNQWKNAYGQTRDMVLPIHIVARIFTRFYYSIGRLDSDLHDSRKLLGDLMHRYVVIFLNSVLVEECLYRDNIAGVRLQNPISSDAIFDHNMKNIMFLNQGDPQTPLYWEWVVACPFWQFFLNPMSNLFTFGSKIFQWETPIATYLGHEMPLYNLFNSVLVQEYRADIDSDIEPEVKNNELSALPNYSAKVAEDILRKQSGTLLKQLVPLLGKPNDMTTMFIDTYLEGKYKFIPRDSDGVKFKRLRDQLVKFIKQHKTEKQ